MSKKNAVFTRRLITDLCQAARLISTSQLKPSRVLHLRPINQVVYLESSSWYCYQEGDLILGWASHLDAFSAYPFRTWLPSICSWWNSWDTRGSSTRVLSYYGQLPFKSPATTTDRDRTVSRRSEPSSRTALMGEQTNPWDLLQPQDAMSRHRGAKPGRRCELSDPISLLSPEYLLSVERWPFHTVPPDH